MCDDHGHNLKRKGKRNEQKQNPRSAVALRCELVTTRSGLGFAAAYSRVGTLRAAIYMVSGYVFLLVAASRRADSGDGRLLLNMCCSLGVVLISYFHY